MSDTDPRWFTELASRSEAPLHVLDVATALLKGCVEERTALHRALDEADNRGWLNQRRDAAARELGPDALHLGLITAEGWSKIRDALLARSAEAPAFLRARAVALALDDRFGAHFVAEYLARNAGKTWALSPGEVVAVPQPVYNDIGDRFCNSQGKRITPPERLANHPVDRLPRLRVVRPHQDGLSVVFDTRFARSLDQLHGAGDHAKCHDISIGLGLVNEASAQGSELTWEWVERGPGFTRLRPIDEQRQTALMSQLVKACGQSAVQALLFPELSTSCHVQAALVTEHRKSQAGPRVMVAGSSHSCSFDLSEDPAKRWNRAVTSFVGASELYLHDKIAPYSFFLPRAGVPHATCEEFITRGTEIRICASKRWFMTVMICKDCLDEQHIAIVEQLGVNFLLVPAHSDHLDDFQRKLSRLVQENLALVALVNGPLRKLNGGGLRSCHGFVMTPTFCGEHQYDPADGLPRLIVAKFGGIAPTFEPA